MLFEKLMKCYEGGLTGAPVKTWAIAVKTGMKQNELKEALAANLTMTALVLRTYIYLGKSMNQNQVTDINNNRYYISDKVHWCAYFKSKSSNGNY